MCEPMDSEALDDEGVTETLTRALDGDLRAVGEALEALPDAHPRRRILLANYRQAMALLGDLPRILAPRAG